MQACSQLWRGAVLSRQNDWKSLAYIYRVKSDISLEDQIMTFWLWGQKKIGKWIICNKIDNMPLQNRTSSTLCMCRECPYNFLCESLTSSRKPITKDINVSETFQLRQVFLLMTHCKFQSLKREIDEGQHNVLPFFNKDPSWCLPSMFFTAEPTFHIQFVLLSVILRTYKDAEGRKNEITYFFKWFYDE